MHTTTKQNQPFRQGRHHACARRAYCLPFLQLSELTSCYLQQIEPCKLWDVSACNTLYKPSIPPPHSALKSSQDTIQEFLHLPAAYHLRRPNPQQQPTTLLHPYPYPYHYHYLCHGVNAFSILSTAGDSYGIHTLELGSLWW